MPLGDGTGPAGRGPGSGRGLGWCFRNTSPGGLSTGSNRGVSLIKQVLIPLGGVVITDLLRPNSVIKQIAGRVFKQIGASRQRYLPKP